MIGFLSGIPQVDGSKLLLLVNGVGYEVHVGNKVLAQVSHTATTPDLLALAGTANSEASGTQNSAQTLPLSLYIHTHVREDALELFGFATAADKELFLLLTSVSGIGPKTALLIADQGAEAITAAVQNANVTFFTKLPRVGKKVAQKIIIELKSKLGSLKELKIGGFSEHEQTIIDAVVALGFEEEQVFDLLESEKLSELPVEQAIKVVLKKMK